MESVKNGELIKTNTINIKNAPSRAQRLLKKGDVLFSCVRPYQHNNYIYTDDVVSVASTGFACLRTEISSDFLYEVINTNNFENKVMERCTGTSYPAINSNDLGNIKVYIPSVDEELKIGNFMSLINNRILTQKKIIEDYKLLLNSIRNKKLGYYDATNTHSTLDNYLIEYCKKTEQNDLYPVLSSTKDGIYLQSEYFNKEAASEDTTGYKILPRNYCTYRSMSDTGSFTFNKQTIIDNGIISPAYPVFTSKINNDFLIEYLNNSSYFKSSLLEMKEGGTRFALSYSKLLKLKIVDISIHEQDNYINIINSYKNIIINEEKILSLLEKQKQYLLNKMFI